MAPKAMTSKPVPPARPPVPSPAPAYTAQAAGQNAPSTANGLSKTPPPCQSYSNSTQNRPPFRPGEERSTTGGKVTAAKAMSSK
ncbi:hypothetical protein TRIUR3_19431 [Triticum urartu]|uniref:Uncharacterized protein n=4 Tax=Triticum TaxID=4564 RepID=M8AHA2_TRIUA|nr:formin-like protein 11 [Triticum aestivum]XP_048575005.1 formin-like protein 11 [Triticum urartu]EMS64295.1 hypothetical protein TRIUR3_19431 [Triticum urartu]